MQKPRKILLSFLIFLNIVFFVGCSYSIPFQQKLSQYHGSVPSQIQVIEREELEGLTLAEKRAKIAEKYIKISFTVIICEVEEKTSTLGEITKTEKDRSFGSGFIAHTGGYILTNYHVIEKINTESDPKEVAGTIINTYYKIYVSQDNGATVYEANLLWGNKVFDMAILHCEEFASLEGAVLKDRTIYCSEDDKINVLEEVIAVGTPIDTDYFNSATVGNISSTEWRTAIASGELYEHLIQHTAPLNHGNSGGALIDFDGNVIGINTLGNDNANSLFFAISIYPAIAILDEVVENYELYNETTEEIVFGFMGTDKHYVANSSNPDIEFSRDGVYVSSVEPNCIINGLKAEDVIIEVKVTTSSQILSFDIKDQNMLLYSRIWLLYAQSAKVKVIRNGVPRTLNVDLGV